jgi:hypothetical protein
MKTPCTPDITRSQFIPYAHGIANYILILQGGCNLGNKLWAWEFWAVAILVFHHLSRSGSRDAMPMH